MRWSADVDDVKPGEWPDGADRSEWSKWVEVFSGMLQPLVVDVILGPLSYEFEVGVGTSGQEERHPRVPTSTSRWRSLIEPVEPSLTVPADERLVVRARCTDSQLLERPVECIVEGHFQPPATETEGAMP